MNNLKKTIKQWAEEDFSNKISEDELSDRILASYEGLDSYEKSEITFKEFSQLYLDFYNASY